MKTHKIIISTLALAMGAALAGSVSGTVAWFQYSTRAQASYLGASAHCSEMLEVTVGEVSTSSVWGSEVKSAAIDTAMGVTTANPKKLEPITSGALTGTDAADGEGALSGTFYKNPIYQFPEYSDWGTAVAANYVQFDLHFHVKDIDGNSTTTTYLEKDLYLTDLTIQSIQAEGTSDLYKAVRVHFATNEDSPTYNLFAKDDSTNAGATISTALSGNLDLNNDGHLDKAAYYEWQTAPTTDLVYGDSGKTQVAKNVAVDDVLADDSDPYSIDANEGLIGKISDANDGLKVTVTIWLEGWTKLTAPTGNAEASATGGSAIWDPATYIGKNFQVGMRFSVNGHDHSVDHA